MAISTINIGTSPNDGTGDPLRTAFQKTNTNLLNITADGGNEITVTDPTTSTDAPLNDALQNIFDSGGGATPNLQQVLAQGGRGILKINDALETYTTVLADRGKIIIIPTTATLFTELIIDDVYSVGDTILIYSQSGGQTIKTSGASSFLPINTSEISTVYQGDLISITLVEIIGGTEYIYSYNVMPYEIISSSAVWGSITGTLSSQTDLQGALNGKQSIAIVVSSDTTAVNDTNYTVVANATFTDPSPSEGKGYVVYVRNGTATIGGTGYAVGSLVFRVFHSGAWSSKEYKSNLTASDIPTGIDATKLADGSVSNTEFQRLDGVTGNIQTQIDSKENAITAGTTAQYFRGDKTFQPVANLPISTATQTALDLRVRTMLNDNVDSSAVTGVTANTIIKSYLIPANTLAVGDTIDLKSVVVKTGTNATSSLRLFTNTSNSLTGASALSLLSASANSLYQSIDRTYTLKSDNTLQSFPVGSTAVTDEATVTATISNTSFNPTVDNWFIIAVQPNSASDSFRQTLCYITLMKAKTTI